MSADYQDELINTDQNSLLAEDEEIERDEPEGEGGSDD